MNLTLGMIVAYSNGIDAGDRERTLPAEPKTQPAANLWNSIRVEIIKLQTAKFQESAQRADCPP
jgi:hypothetical protein